MSQYEIRGIVISVGFDDLLSITLPRNMKHMDSCLVVTDLEDDRTYRLVETIPHCSAYRTDAFTRGGAKFNKGLAMEEGFQKMHRDGWILVWDADVLMPSDLMLPRLEIGKLYNAPRRIMDDPREWYEGMSQHEWFNYPPGHDKVHAGYFQLFHADDAVLVQEPWYDVTFSHAGGGDGYFQSRWRAQDKVKLQSQVLHLGPRDTNWFGRVTGRTDGADIEGRNSHNQDMTRYLGYKGWKRNVPIVEDFQEHVVVPGHQPSGFVLKGRKDK